MIPVSEPFIGKEEKANVLKCLDSGWISSGGEFLSRFEKDMAAFVNRKFAVAVTNGSVAIDIAIDTLDLKRGDEVIVPNFTIISCISEIIRRGITPVFVEVDANTWNIDVTLIEEKISPRTRALIMVHTYGLTADVDPIIDICERHGLFLIEDAAEAIGQVYKNRKCGSFGIISTTSFYANKFITTGEGGMVFTDDSEIYEKICMAKNLGFNKDANLRFIHEKVGWNARMTNIQAAIGCAQLSRYDQMIQRKRSIGLLYTEMLSKCANLILAPTATDYCENLYWVFGVVINDSRFSGDEIRFKLRELGIETRPFFYPLDLQPIVANQEEEVFNTISSNLYQNGLYLPSSFSLNDSDVKFIANVLIEIIK